LVGPGVFVRLTSDLVGPIPNDSQWQLSVYTDTELGENGKVLFEHKPASVPLQIDWRLQVPEQGKTQEERPATAQQAQTVKVLAEVRSPTLGHQDTSDFQDYIWTINNIGTQIALTQQAQVPIDNTVQLQAIQDALTVPLTAVGQALTTTVGALLAPFRIDFSPSISLSGGVTCDPVRLNLSGAAFYGIKVHVVTIPDDWRFGTPDGDWGFHDLAVLSCWINDDQLVRCGIHTPSFVLTPLPGTATPFISTAIAELQPPGYAVHVDWAPGVCGEVLGINLPVSV
jgi:hypothetical protein